MGRFVRIRISARKSDLARIQAKQVGRALQNHNSKIEVEYHFRESLGDKNLTDPLWKIPEKGVFTEDFLEDLLTGSTDLVVHSWKDLPTAERTKTMIACTLPRADQRDLLLVKKASWGKSKLQLLSSSPRREYNLSSLLPELIPWNVQKIKFSSIRGNIQTRVRKLIEDPQSDGLILAKAAMDRLLTANDEEFEETKKFLQQSLDLFHYMVLPLSLNPCAAAQGALAIEIRSDREDLKKILALINCEKTFNEAQAERNLLQQYGGGCHLALGMSTILTEDYRLTFVRGQNPEGVAVEKKELVQNNLATNKPNFELTQTWSLGSDQMQRTKINPIQLDPQFGYIVSRFEAWPSSVQQSPKLNVWTSGVQTWKKLASLGVWVLGTYDSLGEGQDPQIENLSGPIIWKTLTHQRHPFFDLQRHIVTYETEPLALKIHDEKYFFWRSSSQFLQAIAEKPSIKDQFHATGPGSTLRTLREHISADRIFIFLNEEEWRKSCQQT